MDQATGPYWLVGFRMPGVHGGRCPIGPWAGFAALAILATAHAGSGDPASVLSYSAGLPAETPMPIAVAGGRASFEVPTPQPGSKTLVIVSSLARGAGLFPVRLSAWPASQVNPLPLADDGPRRPPVPVDPPSEPMPLPALGLPPAARTFHLMVRDGDVASASNYLAVESRLRAVGQRVQVYVDSHDIGLVRDELLRDVVSSFDERIYPTAARWLGLARDVDADGRFTVLITGWLTHLAGGRLAVDGFVRGADFDPDLGAPFGNRCDMMYLSASIARGPHLRTVVAHEYTHAVTASLKAFGGSDGGRWGPEEEGWLDEGLAHLAEDLHGFSRSNLDYRISAFLSSPERYRLVVEDYYAADLFRSHGNRGSTYLFLRWCADRFGPDLLGTLARSPRRGIANLEAATGTPFRSLYRQWSVALAQSGLNAGGSRVGGYRALDLRGAIDGWPLAGPRMARVRSNGPADIWSATGTSSHFVLVDASPTGAVHIAVTGPEEADLQVTVVPLPVEMARLELTVEALAAPDGALRARARIRERDGSPVRLSALAWEPLVPTADAHALSPHHGKLDTHGISAVFGSSEVPAGGTLASQTIALTGVDRQDVPIVVKVIGTDVQDRRVAAWAELKLAPAGADDLAVDESPAP